MRYLGLHEDLVGMAARLRAHVDRPVYVASCERFNSTKALRLPGGREPRRLDALEVFLSTWRALDYDPKVDGRELVEADVVHVVYPLRKDEQSDEPWFTKKVSDFAVIGLREEINSNRSVHRTEDVKVSVDLAPYVAEFTQDRRGDYSRRPITGILFAISEPIERPLVLKDSWHIGVEDEPEDLLRKCYGMRRAAVLHPPGRYSGRRIISSEGMNNVLMLDEDPGRCVVCHGRSGERVHLAFVDRGSPTCPVCRVCTGEAFLAWRRTMDEWSKTKA